MRREVVSSFASVLQRNNTLQAIYFQNLGGNISSQFINEDNGNGLRDIGTWMTQNLEHSIYEINFQGTKLNHTTFFRLAQAFRFCHFSSKNKLIKFIEYIHMALNA